MKKLIAFSMLIALLVMIPTTILANDADSENASKFCTANDDFGYSHGKCVSTVMLCFGPGNTGSLCACKFFLHTNPEGFYEEYNNLGECVNHMLNGYVFE